METVAVSLILLDHRLPCPYQRHIVTRQGRNTNIAFSSIVLLYLNITLLDVELSEPYAGMQAHCRAAQLLCQSISTQRFISMFWTKRQKRQHVTLLKTMKLTIPETE